MIREQAREKRLDPALIAAVIYAETKFTRTSPAGAKGLMQIIRTPRSSSPKARGPRLPPLADLAEPEVNIAYGSYYLRYLLHRYRGDETWRSRRTTAGATNVDRWLARAHAAGGHFTTGYIGFRRRVPMSRGRAGPGGVRRRVRPVARRRRGPLPRTAGSDAGRYSIPMPPFRLDSVFTPAADQPRAIEQIAESIEAGDRFTTLLGATGTGKTMTMAGVIQAVQRPALVIAHNKTLAAQLCNEFRTYFPDNAVEYFVSYYDYYQPEAYVAEPRPLHREGLLDQLRDRPPAPLPRPPPSSRAAT